ncbi:HAD family phosphatase [Candidatus Kaiserbacteria bacterium]|nr:HAD family phosphatase [Candidatus Kaiserbacteria bacterium]
MDIKCILFDSDGVVADTDSIYFEINSELIHRYGIKHTREDYIQYSFLSDLGSAGFLEQNHVEDIAGFKNERNQRFIQRVKNGQSVASSTVSEIAELSKKYKIGIVTNASQEVFTSMYEKSGLLESLDLIITREKYDNPKPDPDCYLKAIRESNMPSDQIVAVEDSPRGIAAARSAGLKTVHFQNKHFPEVTADADYKITRISELSDLLTL